jgi:hypothetical protein
MKILGYILSLAGLAAIVLSKPLLVLAQKISPSIKLAYVIVAGVALVAAGVVFLMDRSGSNEVRLAAEEVPIYQGEGKNKRIVGYKKASKK